MIAVLDYGIGNLRSAEKALQHLGADAASGHRPRRGRRRRRGRPARRRRLRCLCRGAAAQRPRGGGRDGARRGHAVPRHLRRHADALRGLGGGPRHRRPRRPARPRSERLPAGVKRPQMQWNRPAPPPARARLLAGLDAEPWVYFVHSYAPASGDDVVATCDYGGASPPPSSAARVWATQFHPEKSGAVGLALLANFVERQRGPTPPAALTVELFPAIDLRDGAAVRLVEGDFDRETLLRRPGRRGPPLRRRPGPAGSTSSTSTRPAPASPSTGPRSSPSPPPSTSAVQVGRRSADAPTPPPRSWTAAWPGWCSARRRSSDPGLVDTLAAAGPAGWPSASTTAAWRRAGRGRLGRRHGGTALADALARGRIGPPLAAVIVTDIARDGTSPVPTWTACRRCSPATDPRRHRLGRCPGSADDLAALGPVAVRHGRRSGRRHRRQGPRRGRRHRRGGDGGVRSVRVIPCLDVDGRPGGQRRQVRRPRDAGDPVELAARYDAEGADELVFSTSPPRPTAATPWSRWWPGRPSRSSSP